MDQYIKDIFEYDPNTGVIYYKLDFPKHYFATYRAYKVFLSKFAGKPAGYLHKDTGYMRINIKKKAYVYSRVAWFLYYGVWPNNDLDHEDRNKLNNRITNLADVTHAANMLNRENNLSGHINISYNKSKPSPFIVRITSNYKVITNKAFDNIEEAIKHRDEVRDKWNLPPIK